MLRSEWYRRMYESCDDKSHPMAQMFYMKYETLVANDSWWDLIKQDYENIVEFWTWHIKNVLAKLFYFE